MNALIDKLKRFAEKDYRDGYLNTHVRASIAYQIKALRQKFGLSQRGMAERTGKTQSVISRLESDGYGQMSLQSLLDIASGLDVALVVRFVSYPEFLKQAASMSERALQPDTIFESLAKNSKSRFSEYNSSIVHHLSARSDQDYSRNLTAGLQHKPLAPLEAVLSSAAQTAESQNTGNRQWGMN